MKRNMPSGRELATRWAAGDTKWPDLGLEYGHHPERLRSKFRNWRRAHRQEWEAIKSAAPSEDEATKSTFTTEGNYATAVTQGRIISLEQLLEVCQVDLSIWTVDRYEVNKWEVGAKDRDVDLEYADGAATGHVRKGGLKVEPLFQVKAWLKRRRPIALEWPAIQAAHIEIGKSPPLKQINRGFRRRLIFGDSQIGYWRDHDTGQLNPFHDRAALDIIVQVANALQPDEIADLGDGSDLPEFSDKFYRSPEFIATTQPMIYERAWWYGQLRQAALHAQIDVHEGNHDFRLPAAVARNFQASARLRAADMRDDWPVMSVPFLLGLQRMGINWIGDYPQGHKWITDDLVESHGDIARSGSGDTTKALLRDTKYSHIMGHIHRSEIAMASRTDHFRGGPVPVRVISPGCTCRVDGAVPATNRRVNWQQGFIVLDYDPSGSDYSVVFAGIRDGRVMVAGQMFEARDRLEQMRDEVNYAF